MAKQTLLIRRFALFLANTVFFVGVIVMGVMSLHITADVLARYLLGIALPGTIAFVQSYYMIAVTFLPLAVAEIQNQHIEVEVLASRLPRPLQSILTLVAWILATIVFFVLTWVSSIQAWDAYELGIFIVEQDAKIETWMSYFMLPLSFGASAVISFSRILIALFGLGEGLTQSTTRAAAFFDGQQNPEIHDV